ncbi:unnamed protein product [Mytilus coruscus]|uniref:Uncharacterized protein n=1 Tax=Mytilus coruscus TaxID=42192 RepID=A0A6J8BML6_MYTCO|nr:unnamed protein product [Mytilus coruscus]
MGQLLNEESPPEAVIPSDQLFAKYLHDLSPVHSPDTFSIDLEPQEPAESYLNLNSTVSNIQEPAPLDFTTSITNNQEPAEASLNLNYTVSNIQEPAPLEFTTSISNNQEPAESSLNLNSTVSNIQEPAPLDFTTSITNNQEPAEASLNLNSTVSNIQEPEPLDFTTSITNNQEPAESSVNLNSTVSNIQEPAPLDFTTSIKTTVSTIATASTLDITTSSITVEPTASSKESIATIHELLLDLSMKTTTKLNPKPVEIPRKPLTPIIDCTIPTDIWNVKPLSLETNNYEHLCLDPRVYFARAPSQYSNHMLASTLKEKVNLCRTSQKARYKRQLVPVGVRTIMKEERDDIYPMIPF